MQKLRWYIGTIGSDLRIIINWTWLLPALLIIASLCLARITYSPPANEQGSTMMQGHGAASDTKNGTDPTAQKSKKVRTATVPDYATSLQNDLESYLPLISVFLVVPLVSQEWQRGTITQLALRKSLGQIFCERLFVAVLYLVLLVSIGAFVALNITVQPLWDGSAIQWIGYVLMIALPSTLFLVAVAVVCSLLTIHAAVGYLVAVGLWGFNFLVAQLLAKNENGKSDAILYTLNGAKYQDSVMHPDMWLSGKCVWLFLALLLLACVFPLVRQEARMIRNMEE